MSGSDIELTWTDNSLFDQYEVHRSATPFFTPNTTNHLATLGAGSTSYTDAGAGGDVAAPVFYIVRGLDAAVATSSQEVGAITYPLNNAPGSYSLIALPFAVDGIVDAAALAEYIGRGEVGALLKWNQENQIFRFFVPSGSGDNFALVPGEVVYVVVPPGGPTTVTFAGNVMPLDQPLARDGYNFISLPLQIDHVSNAATAAIDIGRTNALLAWNNATQTFRFFVPPASGDNFGLSAGAPFIVRSAADSATEWAPGCPQYGQGELRSSKFGVQMYDTSRPGSKYFDALVDSRAGWVRVAAPWWSAEPTNTTPENFRWNYIDGEIAAAGHVGTEIIATFGYAPEWAASNPNSEFDRTTLTEFTQFLEALVERYDGDGIDDAPCSPVVNYWEFFNEPDRRANQEVGYYRNSWGDLPDEYVAMLAAAYPVVRAANPNAKVVFGGIAYEKFGLFAEDFTDNVLKAGGAQYFDIMNFHVYPEFWAEHATQPPGVVEKTAKIRAILTNNGVTKPMFITETGATSDRIESINMSDEEQARFVPMVFAQSLAADVDVSIWFMLNNNPDGAYVYKAGLVTADDPPVYRPSMAAYQVAMETFEGLTYRRTLTRAERGYDDLLAYEFTDYNGGTVVVAWRNPATTNSAVTLSLPGTRAVVRDLFGLETTVNGSGGTVNIRVYGRPVYIYLD